MSRVVTALLLVNINGLCNQRVHLNDNNVLEMEMISLCVFETFLRKNDKTIAVQPGSVKMTKTLYYSYQAISGQCPLL